MIDHCIFKIRLVDYNLWPNQTWRENKDCCSLRSKPISE